MSEPALNLYSYLDYRTYLRDLYTHNKKVKPQFSFRYFSKQAGFNSPNYLKMVMDGERNLTQDSILKFRDGLKLNKDDGNFFENLVHYTQCKTLKEKNLYYEKMSASPQYLKFHLLESRSFDYFSHWYNVAIREMVSLRNFRPDPLWISCNLKPRINIGEAKQALELLLSLGLIEKQGNKIVKGNGNLVTARETHSLAVTNIHKELIQKGLEAMDRFGGKERDAGSLTVAIKKEKIPAIKEMIQNFRRQLHAFLQDDKDADMVYQIHLLLFPLAASAKEEL